MLIDIDNFFNNEVVMSSLVTNLNSLTVIGSTVQEIIVNWVHSHRRRDSTRHMSLVGGVYWALVDYFTVSHYSSVYFYGAPERTWCVIVRTINLFGQFINLSGQNAAESAQK